MRGEGPPAAVSLSQPVLSLCDPTDCSPPGSSVHGALQARTLEWIDISSSRVPSPPRARTRSRAWQADSLPAKPGHQEGSLAMSWNSWPGSDPLTSSHNGGKGGRGDKVLHWEEQKALAEGEGLTPGALVSSGPQVSRRGHALGIHLHRWRPHTRVTAGSRAIWGTRAGHFSGGLGHLPTSVTRRDQRLGGLDDATEPWANSPVCLSPGRPQPHAGPWPALSQVVRSP